MITDKDITVVRLPADPEFPFDAIVFEAHLRLSCSHMLAPDSIDLERDPEKVKTMIEASLKARLLHHVYGDLRRPLNDLLMMAQSNPNADQQDIVAIRNVIKDLL